MLGPNYPFETYDGRNVPEAGYHHGVGERGKTGTKSNDFSDKSKPVKGSGSAPLKMA